ncbi:hypothetical protein B5G04_00215 [Bacteroides sp. An51A]|nr:hypothetical protein B5G04_00215 [Bacteroides sp. An51A]
MNIRISPNCLVGAYRIRPNTSTNPRGCLQGVCDTPLHGMFADIQYLLNKYSRTRKGKEDS